MKLRSEHRADTATGGVEPARRKSLCRLVHGRRRFGQRSGLVVERATERFGI